MIKQVMLSLILGGFMLLPSLSHADSQCTTTELDLVCPEGQYLEGITSEGVKKCKENFIYGTYRQTEYYEVTYEKKPAHRVSVTGVIISTAGNAWLEVDRSKVSGKGDCVREDEEVLTGCNCPPKYYALPVWRELIDGDKELLCENNTCTKATREEKYSLRYMCYRKWSD
jgi:hypothetical protein